MLADLNSSFDQFSGFTKNAEELLAPEKLLEKENFLYVLFLKIRCIFTGKTLEANFKDDLFNSFSDFINKKYPDFINYRRKILCIGFSDSIAKLNDTNFFIKKFINFSSSSDELAFFNTVISYSVPEFSNLIDKNCDPFELEEKNDECVNSKELVLKKFEKVVLGISDSVKEQMHDVYRDTVWLLSFSKLDFGKFAGFFKNQPSGEIFCNFFEAVEFFEELSTVVNRIPSFSEKTIEGLFYYASKRKLIALESGKTKEEQSAAFSSLFRKYVGNINSFVSGPYLAKLGKIINQNYYWKPQSVTYNTKWYDLLCENERIKIAKKWNFWKREKVRVELAAKVKEVYSLEVFPMLPNRPWCQLKNAPSLKLEHTAGYFHWYAEKVHGSVLDVIHQLQMDGVFVNQENRNELSAALIMYEESINGLKDILARLAPKGKFGLVFEDISASRGSLFKAESQVKSMLGYVDGEIKRGAEQLFKSAGIMAAMIAAIFEAEALKLEGKNPVHPKYLGVSNFNEIKSPLNAEWKAKLKTAQSTLENCTYFLQRFSEFDSIA